VPLNSACRKALDEWASARADQLAGGEDEGPGQGRRFVAVAGRGPDERPGRRLGVAPLGLGCPPAAIGPHPSPHLFTNLVRSGADVVLVAEIAGHRRLDTTRRYSLPSQADKDAALEAVLVET